MNLKQTIQSLWVVATLITANNSHAWDVFEPQTIKLGEACAWKASVILDKRDLCVTEEEVRNTEVSVDGGKTWISWEAFLLLGVPAVAIGWATLWKRGKRVSPKEIVAKKDLRKVDPTISPNVGWTIDENDIPIVNIPIGKQTTQPWVDKIALEQQKIAIGEMLKSIDIKIPKNFEQVVDDFYLKFQISDSKWIVRDFSLRLSGEWELSIMQDDNHTTTMLAPNWVWYNLKDSNDRISISLENIRVALLSIQQEMAMKKEAPTEKQKTVLDILQELWIRWDNHFKNEWDYSYIDFTIQESKISNSDVDLSYRITVTRSGKIMFMRTVPNFKLLTSKWKWKKTTNKSYVTMSLIEATLKEIMDRIADQNNSREEITPLYTNPNEKISDVEIDRWFPQWISLVIPDQNLSLKEKNTIRELWGKPPLNS